MPRVKRGPKPGTAEDLAAQFPAQRIVTVRRLVKVEVKDDGRKFQTWEECEVEVNELLLPQVARMSAIIARVATTVEQAENVLRLAADHPDELTEAVAIAIDQPKEWVERIGISGIAAIAFVVIELNIGFFVRRLGPRAFELMGTIFPAATAGAGPTPSDTFSGTDTPIQPATH
jgi:hypothetical protein